MLQPDRGAEFVLSAVLRWLVRENFDAALIEQAASGSATPASFATVSTAMTVFRRTGSTAE